MITDFEVERRAIAVDVSFVEGVGSTNSPRASMVFALEHGVEGVMLGSQWYVIGTPSFAVGAFDKV